MTYYCLENHRTPEQLAEMQRLEAAGICLFCPKPLREEGTHEILWEGAHWTLTPNAYPYKGTTLHLLLLPHDHVTDLADLPEPAQLEFFQALRWTRTHYALTHYGLGVRNGDCRHTGGTIRHLHAHLLVGDPAPQAPPVRFRMSS
jgi:ATP adenylyltransferase